MSFAIYISHIVPDFYQIRLKKCETTKLNRGRNKIRACCLPSSCHQTRCFLEEWETCSGSWSDRARSATPELCPALTPLTLDLFIQIGPLHTSISLSSASAPILSVLTSCQLAPWLRSALPLLGSSKVCPRSTGWQPWPFPATCYYGRGWATGWAGREGDTKPGNSQLVC